MGDVGDGLLQLLVAGLVLLPLAAELAEAGIQLRRQTSDMPVTGGEEQKVVGISLQTLPQLGGNLVQPPSNGADFHPLDQDDQKEQPGEHGRHLCFCANCSSQNVTAVSQIIERLIVP